jgi:hypothetical protein
MGCAHSVAKPAGVSCCCRRRRLFEMSSHTTSSASQAQALTGEWPAVPALLLAVWLCSACVAAPPPGPPAAGAVVVATAPPAADVLLAKMRAEIGEAACDDDAQCRSLGVGSRPCGGPEAYLAWSTKEVARPPTADVKAQAKAGADRAGRLQALAVQHREARRQDHERSGVLSDCAVCRPRASDNQRVCQTPGAAPSRGVVGAP